MYDPIGSFERIRDLYLSYLDTAFRIGDEGLRNERRGLLRRPGTLSAEPLLEPMPLYATAYGAHELRQPRASSDPLQGFTTAAREAFVDLVLSGLLGSTGEGRDRVAAFPLYTHQVEMLGRGVRRGSPGVVTSGTGSGKTESFLLPVIARIVREAIGWPKPPADYLRRRWWRREDGEPYKSAPRLPSAAAPDRTSFVAQRNGEPEDRQAGVRALILYPMNALVEDQMVRLRRALDSQDAREAMDQHFPGNRIFFGRYTSMTPVTGWDHHPRMDGVDDAPLNAGELSRRRRKLQTLFEAMRDMDVGQRRAETMAIEQAAESDDPAIVQAGLARRRRSARLELPFMFPSVDGGEITSRWDMQAHPPDILITNVSMLNAMLAREVDRPIFEKTRRWLESSADAYFFLVLDELHLYRGAAGTEVASLLRQLIVALGLDRPEQRHKLQILSSSASLPIEDPRKREQSLDFLWGMYGAHGTFSRPLESDTDRTRETWLEAIVRGDTVEEKVASDQALDPGPFIRFAQAHGMGADTDSETLVPRVPTEVELEWRVAAAELVRGATEEDSVPTLPLDAAVRLAVTEAGRRVAAACAGPPEEPPRPRATSLSHIAYRLFGLARLGDVRADHLEALRGLLFLRGCGDCFTSWFGHTVDAPRSRVFRLHTIFRSLEGLFAPIGDAARPIGTLTVERGSRGQLVQSDGSTITRPLLELVYCEACGDIFAAGRTDAEHDADRLDLLPTEPKLEGLPEQAASQRFEDLSYEAYRVFWPRRPPSGRGLVDDDLPDGVWVPAEIHPETARVSVVPPPPIGKPTSGAVPGFLWRRNKGDDGRGRTEASAGSHLPFACPSCGTTYSPRTKPGMRLSPLRSFRTGFGKTTQLLATELFAVLRMTNKGSKLVAFADSRQEAAHNALNIESHHHQDVKRALVVYLLRQQLREALRGGSDASAVNQLAADLARATIAGDQATVAGLATAMQELGRAQAALAAARQGMVRLEDVLGQSHYDGPSGARPVPPVLVQRLVRMGIHPTDGAGVATFEDARDGRRYELEWDRLFALEERLDWADAGAAPPAPADEDEVEDEAEDEPDQGIAVDPRARVGPDVPQPALDHMRESLMELLSRGITDVVFSKTYFALEESGLGYPVLARQPEMSEAEWHESNAFLRVFADAYRFDTDSDPYFRGDRRAQWALAQQIKTRNRVRRFAEASFGSTGARTRLTRILEVLRNSGHRDGLITNRAVWVRLLEPSDLYYRCTRCGRVHLHRGTGRCTRCFDELPTVGSPVSELRRVSHLARRVEREEIFRLRCEELTGQTEDPAERQRRFKEVIASGSYGPKEYIDLLSVTTTMEVGIDIGQLRGVMLANMPPQRFNYQQRVGRAGRRGQAYSIAVTVCRTRSHDMYYFTRPEKITGDEPPPPFLARDLALIAGRIVRRTWMCAAFGHVRQARRAVGRFAGDWMAPDIHGEFVPTGAWPEYRSDAEEALRETEEVRDRIAAELVRWGGPDLESTTLSVDALLEEIDEVHERFGPGAIVGALTDLDAQDGADGESVYTGLAHAMAEAGRFPMYGMPTRVRNFFLRLDEEREPGRDGRTWWRRSRVVSVDRDTELAVFEFAPGAVITKDKKNHTGAGFTPPLPRVIEKPKSWMRRDAVRELDANGPEDPTFSRPFWMAACRYCGAWRCEDTMPAPGARIECRACEGNIDPADFRECCEPLGYRTDFRPVAAEAEGESGGGYRSVHADATEPDLAQVAGTNVRLDLLPRIRTFRVNRGRRSTDGTTLDHVGFSTVSGRQELRVGGGVVRLHGQHVSPESDRLIVAPTPGKTGVWLAAPKTTEALALAPHQILPGLRLAAVAGPQAAVSVRAAALSALFLLVDKASLHLDIDPDEFEVLEPGLRRREGVAPFPMLEFTDHLVNGAGYCRELNSIVDGEPLVVRLLRDLVAGSSSIEPLDEILDPDHVARCDQACYRCLLRYRNQPFHGLLDWQLGLTFLESLLDGDFSCGLDGVFAAEKGGPMTRRGLEQWPRWARTYAEKMISLYRGEVFEAAGLIGVRLEGKRPFLVVHPLWNSDDPTGVLMEATEVTNDRLGQVPLYADTFNLARRPAWVFENLGSLGP